MIKLANSLQNVPGAFHKHDRKSHQNNRELKITEQKEHYQLKRSNFILTNTDRTIG
jgi:hypothetical protein